jgi:eukaryotic-like serine/threonine-protein kinase
VTPNEGDHRITDDPLRLPGQLTRLLEDLMHAPEHSLGTAPSVGERLGRFLLVREIGKGGFGLVFEAEDTELRRRVALKVLRPERVGRPTDLEWIRREAEAAAQVHHSTVVTLHDVGQWDGGTYLVYELLEGETLAARLQEGRLERREALRILRSVAVGLSHIHRAGVVHRDVKPVNVFLESNGGVKILDLGLAQVAGAVGITAGSPPYAAPEQWRGGATDARADVYAWGVIAERLLTGYPAGKAPETELVHPSSLRRLIDQARSEDPARRPEDGTAVVAALDRLERRRRRNGALLLATAGLLLVGLTFGLSRLLQPPASRPSGPFRVALADAENGSGKPSLDGLGDLIARGLQGSHRLQVLDRARLEGVLRASGRSAPDRLDRGLAIYATRQAGGAALLVPAIDADGETLSISVEALEPESGKRLFRIVERAGSEDGVLAATDRLVRRVRASLQDRESDVRGADQEVTRAVSSSLQAHQHYLAGVRCVDRPSEGGGADPAACERLFRRALAIDPDFPLAHFELARVASWNEYPSEELRAFLDPAIRRLDRLPAREQALVRAWEANVSGDPDAGIQVLRAAAKEFPEDARLAFALGDLLCRQGRRAEAVPDLERALALDPGFELAADSLVWSLGLLDRKEDLLRLAARLAASPPSSGTLASEARARGFAGDVEGALRVARSAAPGGTGLARDHLENALVAAGRWSEAEGMLRDDAVLEPGRAGDRIVRLLLLRGRFREAQAILDQQAAPTDPRLRYLLRARQVNQFLAPRGDLAGVQRIVDETAAWSPEIAAEQAPTLAYVGGAEGARKLEPFLRAFPGTRALVDALVTWRREGPGAALPALRKLARADPASVESGPPEAASWYAAECALEVAPDEAALDDLRRFQRFFYPMGQWRTWAYPRSLLLEAKVLDGLGRRAEARDALARFEDLWAEADPDQPLVAEARRIRRHLGPGGASFTQAPNGGGRESQGGTKR